MQKQPWLRTAWLTLMLSAVMFGTGISLRAQATAANADIGGTSGAYLFKTYCGSCHGTSGKGDGPLADSMRRRPADLTEIAKRNGGTFPFEQVFRTIDGRQPVRGHGGAEMPAWGDAFMRSAEGGDEQTVKARIDSLVRYIESIQAALAQ